MEKKKRKFPSRGRSSPVPQTAGARGLHPPDCVGLGERPHPTSLRSATFPRGKAHPLPQAVRDEGGGWGAQAASAGRENGLIRPRFARPPSPGGEGACPAASIKNGPPRKTAKGRNHSLSDHRTGGPLRPLFSCARQSVTCPGSPGTSRTAPESPGGSPRPCPSEPALGPSPCRKS